MKLAIITGITGQDGSYLAKLLLEKGYKVVGTLRGNRSIRSHNFTYLGIEDKIVFEELDLLDLANVIRLIQKYRPNEIYNLAAQSSVGVSFEQPIGTFSFNTISVNNLLEAIRLFSNSTKFYQASSSEMFGQVAKLPITLETPMNPVSPYGVSKMASYFMIKTYRESYDLFLSNGILFNHESFLRSDNFFIKKVIKDAINLKKNKIPFIKVGNLNVKRDFGFAPAYVEAMWAILQTEKATDFIICSGFSIKLIDIVEYIFDKLELSKKLIIVDEKLFRPNEIFEIYGDNTKSKLELNWNYNLHFFDVLDNLIDEELNYSNYLIHPAT